MGRENQESERADMRNQTHYSDQTGHRDRGNYWRHIRGLGDDHNMRAPIPVENDWLIRRAMRRTPRSGR